MEILAPFMFLFRIVLQDHFINHGSIRLQMIEMQPMSQGTTVRESREGVQLLLSYPLFVLGISCDHMSSFLNLQSRTEPTLCLFGMIARECTNDSVFLAFKLIDTALDPSFGLGCVVFGLSSSVLLLAGLDPGLGARGIADGFYDSAFDRVELAIELAVRDDQIHGDSLGQTWTYEGSPDATF